MKFEDLVGQQVDGHVEQKFFRARNGDVYPYEIHHVNLPESIVEALEASQTQYRIKIKGGVYTQDFVSSRLNLKVDKKDEGFFISEVYYG